MSLDAMRYAVARLLTDAEYRARFFRDAPASAGAYGLTPEEFRALAQLDARKLEITSEGYAGKRLERVGSSFPRALRALDALEPGGRARYLATTPFAVAEEAERATFLAFLAAPAPWSPDAQRFLQDLAALEAALLDAPRLARPPAYRERPEARPRRTPLAEVRVALRGPLERALAEAAPPAAYPERPAEALAMRDGPALAVEPLAGGAGALLAACDGSRTLAQLAREHGPDAAARVSRWLRCGVVEDVSTS